MQSYKAIVRFKEGTTGQYEVEAADIVEARDAVLEGVEDVSTVMIMVEGGRDDNT